MLIQTMVPVTSFAEEITPEQNNLVKVGSIDVKSYPQLDAKTVQEANRRKKQELQGRKMERGAQLFKAPYFPNPGPNDKQKPLIYANVNAIFTTKGLDGGNFDWEGVFGKDSDGNLNKAQIVFEQIDDDTSTRTGIKFFLKVDTAGTYTWTDSEGKPTKLPLYSTDLKAYRYEVLLDEDVTEHVKLLTARFIGTEGGYAFGKPDPVTGEIVGNINLDLSLQQIASTKFTSKWNTGVAEAERPTVEGSYLTGYEADPEDYGIFKFPSNDTDKTIIRNDQLDPQNPGEYSEYLATALDKTPKVGVADPDPDATDTYTIDRDNSRISYKGKTYKYDLKYDVINGGKLTMTEIIPLTFDANGGKFTNFTAPDTKDKITKEVDYDGTLNDKAEIPTKERETFKGWGIKDQTSGNLTPATDADFANIKEAKTFYAIWDNNDITAKELTVHESFKNGDTWVNDFIPTLDQLKGQVEIKDASGTPQALKNDDTFAIVDGDKEYTADGDALKNYLYGKLQEKANPNDEPTRVETVKAKVTHANGTSQTVDISIKVIKNYYEAKTLTEKPFYVPKDYVKVTVDPTTKATEPQKTYYYVNKEAKVVIPGTDPTGTDGNKFVKWVIGNDEFKFADRHQFGGETIITAQYVSDVIPQEGDTKPEGTPDNFVKVTFNPTENGTMKGAKIFWVNPEKDVTIPVEKPVGKEGYTFKEWKMGADANGAVYTPSTATKFKTATTITATYTKSDDIIPFDPNPKDKDPMVRPKGYVKVSFDADAGLKLKEVKYYYVKKNAGITLKTIKEGTGYGYPDCEEASGYKFKEWEPADTTEIKDKDIVVTAKARKTYSECTPDYRPDDNYETRYKYRDRIVEKEKIVEKIVKVGSDDMLKEIRYMQGFEGKFRPYDGLRRCEAAQILANALKADGYRYNEHYALSYTDVGNEWYTDAIRVVTQAGVFAGYNDGTFKPNGKITRAEWISTLRRFQNLRVEAGNLMNLKPGHWASGEVGAALMAGWLEIYVNGTVNFDADAPITRQEVAAVSNKAFRRVLDKVYLRRSVNTLLNYKDINPSMPLYEDILCASNTLLTDGRYYKANTIVMDNVTFNIVTDLLKITQKKFQYNGLR